MLLYRYSFHSEQYVLEDKERMLSGGRIGRIDNRNPIGEEH